MTPHDLLANFEVLAKAPNGIQRLRELVLELAVRGKLVEQDPTEGTAQNQFSNLCSGKLGSDSPKRGRQLKGPDAPEPAPDDLPSNALWVPIGGLMDLYNGRAFKPNEWATTGLPIIRIQNLNDPSAPFNFCNFEVPEKVHVRDGDLLISWSGTPGTSFGAFIWTRGHAVLNQHIFRVELRHPHLVPDYIRLSVNARLDEMISRAHGGVGLRHITKGELEAIGIPIPPEAEQRRIVARVDELMALLDRLAAKRQEREAARSAARDSALAALREAPTPDDVETAWLRIQERFLELFATPEDVAALRQAVLQLAVSGRLVEQDPDCTGAEGLLAAIQAERRLMVKSGLIKVPKPCATLADDELPFHPPKGWVWCRLGDLVSEGPTNGWSPTTVDYPTEVRTLALSATTKGWFDASRFKYVDAEVPSDSPLWLLPGDLLIQRSNTRDYVGMPAVFNGAPGEFIYPDLMMRCRFPASVSVSYVHLFLLSTYGRSFIQSKASGTSSSMVKVGQEVVRSIPVALPPAEEQLRILEAMGTFNRALDRLAAALNETTGLSDSFSAAAVHHLEA